MDIEKNYCIAFGGSYQDNIVVYDITKGLNILK